MVGIGSMYRYKLAKMRHRITVKYRQTTQDDTGQPIESWVDRFEDEPASFQETSGGETIRGRQVEAGVTAVFGVNWRPGYEVTDLVVFEGEEYGIVRIHKPEGIGRFLDLHCKLTRI